MEQPGTSTASAARTKRSQLSLSLSLSLSLFVLMEHGRLPRQARDRHKVVKEYDGTDTQRRAFRYCSRTQLATVAAEKLKPPEGVCYKQRPTLRTWPARYVRIEVSEKTALFVHCLYQTDHFTKTGSGQT